MTAFSFADSVKSQNDCHRQSATLKGKAKTEKIKIGGIKSAKIKNIIIKGEENEKMYFNVTGIINDADDYSDGVRRQQLFTAVRC